MVMFLLLMVKSFSDNLLRSMPAFIVASQLIKIFLSPILNQVLLSFAFIIFVMVYSTVASSLISFSDKTSGFWLGCFFPAQPKINNEASNKNLSIAH